MRRSLPAVETISLRIISDPPGAEIYRESELVGTAPIDLPFAKNNKYVNVTAQLPGMEGSIEINPIERKDGADVKIKLKKLKGPPKLIKKTGSGSAGSAAAGSGASPKNQTGGELGNNPFAERYSPQVERTARGGPIITIARRPRQQKVIRASDGTSAGHPDMRSTTAPRRRRSSPRSCARSARSTSSAARSCTCKATTRARSRSSSLRTASFRSIRS
jgi:hypothetical protein